MTIDRTLRDALLRPRTIALVGASPDLTKNNSRPQRFLKRFAYSGRILPINRSRAEVLGVRAYPDLASAPGPIDHAFIMVPAAAVPDVIDQCCALRIPVATLFSAGFAELGPEGAAVQRGLVAKARAAGLRLLGPNCMRLINVHDRIPLTVNAVIEREEFVPGLLSLVSQSGAMTGSLLSRAQARGLGFSKLISVGNESDLGVGELADLLVDDEHTRAILLFLETFRDSAVRGHQPPRGKRVSVVTGTGGAAAMVADRLGVLARTSRVLHLLFSRNCARKASNSRTIALGKGCGRRSTPIAQAATGAPLRNQAPDLRSGVASDLTQEANDEAALGAAQPRVAELLKGLGDPLVAILVRWNGKRNGCGARHERAHLFQAAQLLCLEVHDHPSRMTDSLHLQTHFSLETRAPSWLICHWKRLAVDAERTSLEDVAKPLNDQSAREGAGFGQAEQWR